MGKFSVGQRVLFNDNGCCWRGSPSAPVTIVREAYEYGYGGEVYECRFDEDPREIFGKSRVTPREGNLVDIHQDYLIAIEEPEQFDDIDNDAVVDIDSVIGIL